MGVSLATAAALEKQTQFLHERGSWNPRDDRTPTAVWLGIFWVGIVAGFSVDVRRYFHEKPAPPMVVNVHAVVFTVWLLIMTAQVLMVVRDRVGWHRKFGWFAAGWTCLMAVLGPWAAIASLAANMGDPDFAPGFLSINIVDMGGFLGFIAWGLASRRNPAAHRRLMMLAMVAIADPGFARFSGNLLHSPHSALPYFVYIFYGNMMLLVLMAVWDWRRGRMMRQFVLGGSAFAAASLAACFLYFWAPWQAVTQHWVEAWARMTG